MSINQPYAARSMNGIITYDDGNGGTMEGGIVTCNELDTPKINVDEIQSKTPDIDVAVYTNLNGNINVGNSLCPLNTYTLNASVLNIQTENVSTLHCNNIQLESNGNVSLYTNLPVGYTNIQIGKTSAPFTDSNVTIDGSLGVLTTINANDYVSSTEFRGERIRSGGPGTNANVFCDGDVDTIRLGRTGIPAYFDAQLNVDIIKRNTYGVPTQLLTTESGATIQMGNVSNSLAIYSPTTITTTLGVQTINVPNPTVATNLYTNLTSGALTIGNVSQSGDIRVRTTGTTEFGINSPLINVGTTVSNGNINIGNNGTLTLKALNLNMSCTNINLSGTTNVSTLNVSTINASGAVLANMSFTTNTMKLNSSATMNIGTTNSALIYVGNISQTNVIMGSVRSEDTTFNLCNDTSATTLAQTVNIANNVSYVKIGTASARTDIQYLKIVGNEITTTTPASIMKIGGANMSATTNIEIGTAQNNVYIGNTSSVGKVYVGDFQFNSDSMNLMIGSSINVSGTMQIADQLTVGTVNMGIGLSTGNIVIGGNSQTGNTAIKTNGTLNLGITAATIRIGTSASTANVIDVANISTTNLNLGSVMTTGQIDIGSVLTTGAITIGGASQTGATAIRTTGAMTIGVASSSIQIGTTSCPSISIGNVSTTSLDLKTPINPNYDTKYTTAGTPVDCIGYFLGATTYAAAFALTSLSNKVMCTFTNVPIGVWLILWDQSFTIPTTNVVVSFINLSIGTTSGGSQILLSIVDSATKTITTAADPDYTVSQIYSNTASTTDIYCSITASFTGTLTAKVNTIATCKMVRIA